MNGLWRELGATDLVQSCGPELAEVLHQVDLMIEVKRKEWQEQYNKADAKTNEAIKKEQEAKLIMKQQQIEYENRIKQLRVDLGALKDAYLKLEKHHVSKPDKLKRVLHEKNKIINGLQRENEALKGKENDLGADKSNLTEEIITLKKQLEEERMRNILVERESMKLGNIKVENEFLTLEHEKLKIKYSNLKKILTKKNAIESVSHEEPIVPKLNLPTPVQNETPNVSECGTPRSNATSSSNSVYVVPIPVFDIDNDETEFSLDAATTTSTPRSRSDTFSEKYRKEDDEILAQLNTKIDSHIQNFQNFLKELK